jgi:exopolysaccharide production protein ExoQ
MSSAEAFVATPLATGRAEPGARRWAVALVTFWLPLVVVLFAAYVLEHNSYFASTQFLEEGDGKNVVELTTGGAADRQLGLLALGAIGALWLVLPTKEDVTPGYVLFALIVAAFALLFLSVLWADDWILTVKRAAQPFLMMIGALGIVKHWSPRQLITFAALCTGVVVLIGVGSVLWQGTFWQGDAYRFGGTLHPNGQAVNCAVLCLASIALFCDRANTKTVQWRWLALLFVAFCFLLLTRSRTTMAAFMAGVAVFFFISGSWTRRFVIVAIPSVMIAFGALLVALPDTGAGKALSEAVSMGRVKQDTTQLTGRLPIWDTVLGAIAKQPLLGYGYGGFWTPQRIWEYSFIHHWEFNHAHSAYFETMLNLGIVGAGLGLLILFITAWGSVRAAAATQDVGYRFIAAVIVMSLVHGFADSNFVQLGFAPLLVMMCIAMVALHGSAARVVAPAVQQYREPISLRYKTALNY